MLFCCEIQQYGGRKRTIERTPIFLILTFRILFRICDFVV